jgi:hypothetical protein
MFNSPRNLVLLPVSAAVSHRYVGIALKKLLAAVFPLLLAWSFLDPFSDRLPLPFPPARSLTASGPIGEIIAGSVQIVTQILQQLRMVSRAVPREADMKESAAIRRKSGMNASEGASRSLLV